MSIDWSKAPEGTTGAMLCHFEGVTVSKGDVEFIPRDEPSRNMYSEGPDAWEYFPVPAPTAVQDWSGSGLPPVGTTCEGQVKNGGNWRTYTVKAVSDEYLIVWCGVEKAETPIRHVYWEFRPIRTAEQIAAGEREKEAHSILESLPARVSTTTELVYWMLENGYSKQAKP